MNPTTEVFLIPATVVVFFAFCTVVVALIQWFEGPGPENIWNSTDKEGDPKYRNLIVSLLVVIILMAVVIVIGG